jgi:Fe-S cluster assembly protein SufD
MTDRAIVDAVVSAFAARQATGPSWLREERERAIGRFAERGLPTTRDEEWKYTSLAPLSRVRLDLLDDAAEAPGDDALAPYLIGDASWTRLVFVNGRYVAKLSAVRPLPSGAHAGSLADALITDADLVRAHLAAHAHRSPGRLPSRSPGHSPGRSAERPPEDSDDPFGDLNTAFWADGAFVRVPAGVELAAPIQLVFATTSGGAPGAMHPRNVIVLDRASRASLVETYVALDAASGYLQNAVTDAVLAPGAALAHQRAVLEATRAVHVGRMRVRQERDSRVESCAIILGGRLVRSETDVELLDAGAECALSGLVVAGGQQHADVHTVVDHVAPRATSRQLYKGVLDGRARGVFSGRVIVRPGAHGTDAHQTNKNLLLADTVEVDSKPQLEIFADDVKCSHGAADGQLGEDAIFYLESRGIGEAAARSMLTRAFANDVLDRIPGEAVRRWGADLVAGRLRGGRVVEAS